MTKTPNFPNQMQIGTHTYTSSSLSGITISAQTQKTYSLAEVQLVGGETIAMMVTASPSLGAHLAKEMGATGHLYLFNDTESLIIKADRIVALRMTKMTTE